LARAPLAPPSDARPEDPTPEVKRPGQRIERDRRDR
jgi:hypothetical protein